MTFKNIQNIRLLGKYKIKYSCKNINKYLLKKLFMDNIKFIIFFFFKSYKVTTNLKSTIN